MKAEYTAEDLKGAVRNPFYEKLIKEVVVPVRREDYAVFKEIADMNGETPESVMKRCLKMAAKDMREHH
jgi:CRP-like cAMP-binding protein